MDQATNDLMAMVAKALADKNDDVKKEDADAFKKRKVSIAREGTKIVLPANPRAMTEDEGIAALQAAKQEKETLVRIHEEFDCFPLEGAWALRKVLERMFGYVMTGQPVETFFGTQPAASLVNLEVGPGRFEQVLWGKFNIPGLKGEIATGAKFTREGVASFVVAGQATIAGRDLIEDIAQEVREFLKTNSLYKSKAIKVKTVENDHGKYQVDFENPPSFMDLTKVNEDELVFSQDVLTLVQTNLFTPIEKTEACRAARIPLKRSVLLEGPYGTGKTLTAFVTAKKAVENGWTFIYMDRAQALRDVLIFARKYAPVAIFCEDIEQVTSGGRTTDTNDVLNNIDGIDSKGHEVLCVFTTNHVEKIEPAMLRPGRLDAVITVMPPDATAAEKLVRVYARDLIAAKEDLGAACKELSGQIPAFIRETVERAKLFAIGRLKDGESLKLVGEDIRVAAVGMRRHYALVNQPKETVLTAGDELALAIAKVTGTGHHYSDYGDEDEAMQHRRDVDAQNRGVEQ